MDPTPSPFARSGHDHRHCVSSALNAAERLCKQRRVRLTPLRRRVLELVWADHKPVGAYELLEALQAGGRAAPPTVYRALDFLQEQGLVHRLASLNAYVGCAHPGTPHAGQFLICQSCRELAELTDPGVAAAIEQSSRSIGFMPRHQTVEVLGVCPRCKKQETSFGQ
ncbi:transcriptional repressor [Desulfuromonas versatilis]|uniref:Transcriptional repressor n=1 Tax=Desulfuromonas versatilis TaxID=2802975 RepID=A0ABM8HQT0_9BACT|nr:Fur family transcriptional regulator [Desulfuromonas versatilis]BCR04223.1 transcriptional repressor [Desulfuromonas versatilis]